MPAIFGTLNRDFDFPQVLASGQFSRDLLIFTNGISDIRQSFLFGRALRPTAGKTWARDTVSFVSLD
jgi:hypothetical protein